MRFLTRLICFTLILALTGCSPRVVTKCTKIPIPDLPERVELERPGEAKKSGIRYLKEPELLSSNETYQAPDGGAIVWNSQDWRHIRYGLVENRRWIDATEKLIRDHNQIYEERPWYKVWGKN